MPTRRPILTPALARAFPFLLALGGMGGACGGDRAESSTEIWCDGVCMAAARCVAYPDPQCQSRCVAQRDSLSSITTEGAAAQKDCLSRLSCQALSDAAAWKAEVDACWDGAEASVAVRPSVRDFCQGYALAWFDCGYDYPLDTCERNYALWTDSVLDRLARCAVNLSCAELQPCRDAVFASL